jgi:hypothetical protein
VSIGWVCSLGGPLTIGRKASTEAPNLSRDEMSFNFSLSISIQVSTTIHRPARGASSGGATCSLCLALYAIMFIELYFNFMAIFCVFLPSCGQSLSLCPASTSSCAILSHAGLLEVPTTNLGSLGYFLAQGPVLPYDCSWENLMLNWGGGSRVCSLLCLVLYHKHVYFVSLMLTVEYWGSGRCMPLNKAITIT